MRLSHHIEAAHRRGSALTLMLVVVVLMTGFAGAALTLTSSSVREVEGERRQTQALYMAEAGIGAGLNQLAVSFQTGAEVAANVGTLEVPSALNTDSFWTTVFANADGTYTIRATGIAGRSTRTIEAIAQALPPGPFEHSVYAGNLSNDPAYQLTFGGTDGQADAVSGGDIYSGGDIFINEDATVDGSLRAHGDVYGAEGQGGTVMDVPEILSIDYERYHDFDVANLFEGAERLADNAGGTAGQLPIESPVHFFRKNPTDRASNIDATTKDDYFLEDPYEAIGVDRDQDGSDAFNITIPADANNRVFYIDGNLWLHSLASFSLKIKSAGLDPTRVTFVVKGNVYFSDNLFYDDPNADGIAFIALTDDSVEDSGNVYFGDPVFGTMRFAEALMFAENNFYDNNLDAAGSSRVEIRGNMTAGNQIAIERDFVTEDGQVKHTKLDLTFDARQANGTLNMPGIPVAADDSTGYAIVTWREVPSPEVFAVPTPTITVAAPADRPKGDNPFQDDLDADGVEARGSNDWRKRWNSNYGKAWTNNTRTSRWAK